MIICLGTTPALSRSMMFDSLTIDEVNRATGVYDYAAGKSPNVARVLHTLGQPATVVGFIGGDYGLILRRDLDAAGVTHAFTDVQPNTRLCVTVIDRAARTATELIEEAGPVTLKDAERLLDHLSAQLIGASMLVLSGSLAVGVPVDFYAQCVRLAHEKGVRTIVDAAGEPLLLAMNASPFLVKPNRMELAKSLGRPIATDADLREAITQLVADGSTWVAVTMGKAGAIVGNGHAFWRITAPQIDVVSAIGSGDSFAAGLAAGIVSGQTVPESARLATACGVANALTERSGHVSLGEVNRLRAMIKLEQM